MTSLILQTAARYLLPIMLLFSIFLVLRGHQEPGGGFVGGLVASASLVLYAIAYDAEAARHLIAALRNTTTDLAPASYVRETFDSYADGFDQHLVSKLAYHAPGLLAQSLRHAIGTPAPSLNILDLGCGTGLFGEAIKDLKKSLVGVDLSPRMIDKARQRQIYDELIVGDILNYLAEANPSQFDLIAATDVFIYVGNLQPIFEQASRILAPGGWFTFSIEAPQNESGDFILDTTGRYQHHQTYLARLSTQFGFIQTKFSESCLRREKDQPVMGYLYLLKKADNRLTVGGFKNELQF